ncbi:ribosome maturation factor RimP [Alkalithermobacter thermoalcaliphilus JW-YL-7 = DSM 7308]|uniref:Ribosome maturation factor RimP n=1 Tax=Alkalithermobacter thermoalcaliphilus JW-YL-7 = DSM 7308 TaxID=1121328 RepID=A0A150FS03_CLOPD|nr:Ribosome maturation factor rimP [[Clostridium] paradoxum JW-YL-7 = DSM 7308]SHK59678.1 ribosome maturation factor RimP [[Clostridium] paradoxum JW-YL-7 = DSM 7308]
MRQNIEEIVSNIAIPFIEKEGFELVDVEYVLEAGNRYLRIYIDKEGGVSLKDCQIISESVSAKLDEIDPIKENYFLEVSSPGLDRPLKKEADFERYKGRDVEVKLYKPLNGKKEFEGMLIGLFDKTKIKISVDDEILEFDRKEIALIRLAVKI